MIERPAMVAGRKFLMDHGFPPIPAAANAPWQSDEFLPRAPLEGYGYLLDNSIRACSLDELRAAISRGPVERIHFVWTPGHGRLVPTGEVPELFDALKNWHLIQNRELLQRKAGWAAAAAVGGYFLGPYLGLPFGWVAMMWGAFFALPVVDGLFRAREWKRATVADAPALGEFSRFSHWLAWRESTKTTHVIIGVLIVTWLLSTKMGNRAIDIFAMDERGVRHGAWWKPLTCFFLHGGLPHLVFNALALSRLGRWVEGLTQAAWVPLILFLSTLGGSLAGYVLPPDVPSVGASGGILGLLGFLIVFCRPGDRQIPFAFRRQLWQWLIYIGLLGAIGWNVIDNAGHLGGLMTGALLGGIANGTLPAGVPPVRAHWVTAAGLVAALILAVTGGRMMWSFWHAPTGGGGFGPRPEGTDWPMPPRRPSVGE